MKRISPLIIVITIFLSCNLLFAEDLVVAKIGQREIKMSDLDRMIGYYDAEKRKILEQQPYRKAIILKRIVQGIVLSKIARDKGFDKRDEIKEQIELLVNDFIATQYLQKEVIDKIDVSDKDIELYYKSHPEEFKTPEMVRARHILIKVDKSASGTEKKEAEEKARELLKRIRAGEDFEKIATEFSEDLGSKDKGGDLGFFRRGSMVPQFEDVAFSLNQGEISDIVESPYGFHIIKVEEKRDSSVKPFEEVKDIARKKAFELIKKAKVEEFFDNTFKELDVHINMELFAPKM